MKVLLAGASGLVGKSLLCKLLITNNINHVSSLVRKKSNIKNTKLSEREINWDNVLLEKFESTFDVAFCCLGTTMNKAGSKEAFKKVDFEYALHFAQLAKSLNVKCFVLVSAMGADKNSAIFYSKVKGETEEAIKNLDFESLYIVRPSLLMGDRQEKRLGEKVAIYVMKFLNPLMIGVLKKYAGVSAEKVANSMLAFAFEAKPGVNIVLSDKLHTA